MATKITAKEALRYILQDILELEDSDIRILSKKGITKFRNLKNLSIKKITQFQDQDNINDGLATDLSLLLMFMTLTNAGVSKLMQLDAHRWNKMDFSALQMKYLEMYGTKNTTIPSKPTNPTVPVQNVENSKQTPTLTTIHTKDVNVTNCCRCLYIRRFYY